MPRNSRYLNPTVWGEIVERRPVNYPKKIENKIASHFLPDQEESALQETRECVSLLAGRLSSSIGSKKATPEEVNKLADKLFCELDIGLNDKQKNNLKNLIKNSLSQESTFGKEIDTWVKEAALKAIKIASQTKTSSSIKETKVDLSLISKRAKIEDFFSENIVGAYKDPLTLKRTESISRFKRLYESIQSLEKELEFFLQQSSHPDTIQLKKEFLWFPYSSFPEYAKSLGSQPYTNITLQAVDDSIYRLKIICGKLIDDPGKPGIGHPAIFKTVYGLADVWKKYTGKEPTLINYPDYSKGPTHGPFLDYLKESIESVIPLEKHISLRNIAKEVISHRKRMAKTSPK
ncbi:MAG: hypothetical protein PHG87_01475 [Candidatus Omnitrophica bacterium]|nr:hypothetical protein [Candidatus Omnitrophota bacterium]